MEHRTWNDPHAETMAEYLHRMAEELRPLHNVDGIDANLIDSLRTTAMCLDDDARTITAQSEMLADLRRERDIARESLACEVAYRRSETDRADRNFACIGTTDRELERENRRLSRRVDDLTDDLDRMNDVVRRLLSILQPFNA